MTYPVISLCLVFGITGFLLVYIVPQFKTIFDGFGDKLQLPTITTLLLGLSMFLQTYYLWIGIGLVASVVLFVMYKKTDKGEWQFDWLKLHMPIFGQLFRKVAISRFSRTFATLIQSGVPILGALEIVASTSGNRLVEDAVNGARESVRQGETLGEPLSQSKVFPPMVTRMIAIGERTGALEKLLHKISEFYDQQVKATVEGLTSMIEPLLIGLMGFIVGGIVLAIFLPIFKLQNALAGGA